MANPTNENCVRTPLVGGLSGLLLHSQTPFCAPLNMTCLPPSAFPDALSCALKYDLSPSFCIPRRPFVRPQV